MLHVEKAAAVRCARHLSAAMVGGGRARIGTSHTLPIKLD